MRRLRALWLAALRLLPFLSVMGIAHGSARLLRVMRLCKLVLRQGPQALSLHKCLLHVMRALTMRYAMPQSSGCALAPASWHPGVEPNVSRAKPRFTFARKEGAAYATVSWIG